MVWYDENPDLINSPKIQENLSFKLEEFNPDNDNPRINIICQDKFIAKQLISTFNSFLDKFYAVDIRLGWFLDESHNLTEVFDDESIFIGYNNYSQSFEKIFESNTCKISKHAKDNSLHVAYQRHFSHHKNPRSISLGELKEKLHHVDPMLRAVDGIFYYLDAIRRQESMTKDSFVSGLSIDEACKIARFAGMSQSNKLIYFNLGSQRINQDNSEVVAMLIWYYLEGSINRNIESLDHKNNHTYMVSNPFFQKPVKFVKTNITGRWWYQHPEDKYFVPCTEEDYISISEGSIPDNFLISHSY